MRPAKTKPSDVAGGVGFGLVLVGALVMAMTWHLQTAAGRAVGFIMICAGGGVLAGVGRFLYQKSQGRKVRMKGTEMATVGKKDT